MRPASSHDNGHTNVFCKYASPRSLFVSGRLRIMTVSLASTNDMSSSNTSITTRTQKENYDSNFDYNFNDNDDTYDDNNSSKSNNDGDDDDDDDDANTRNSARRTNLLADLTLNSLLSTSAPLRPSSSDKGFMASSSLATLWG